MDIRVIFAEPQFNPRVAEAVAREAGGTVLILDPIGGQIDRVTYIDMMRYNLQVMEQVMK
jgi:zinc transport system substrate-binding protein